ncbi:lysis system o-spanin lipoprotein Rz1, partial [Salmonella enterica]
MAGYATKDAVQCLPQPPALAAWVMQASSNSPRGLDRTF